VINQILPFFVIIPILIAVFLYVFSSAKTARMIAIVFQAAFVVFSFFLLIASRSEAIILSVGQYAGFLGIILRADNLAAVFVLLTSIVFLAAAIYSLNDETISLYWFLMFIFEGALVGLFLTRDFFNVFVLTEVGTVVVTILLMYDRKWRDMLAGMKFIMVNIVVMQFFLFGMGYMYMLTGVLDMEAAAEAVAHMNRSDLLLPYALIMTSIASKCSLLPMMTFLPKVNSMLGGRTPVIAIISGLQIKAGVYMFIRVQEVFSGGSTYGFFASEFFLIIGIITAIAGVVLALAQREIRLILAYSTVAQVSLIIIGLSVGSQTSYNGAVFHIVNHAIIKVALFMGAGMIAIRYKTRDITQIRGLFRHNRTIAIGMGLAVLGMMGTPLFNGFMSKYFLGGGADGLLVWVINVINLGTILIFVKFSVIFFGSPSKQVSQPMILDWYKQMSLLALGILCLVLGVGGVPIMGFLFNVELSVTFDGLLEKTVVFLVSLAIGLIFYKYVGKKDILRPLKNLDLDFRVLCATIGVFFGVLLVFAAK